VISVAKNGSNIVMAQGSEAGGHRSIFDNNGVPDNGYENIPLIWTMALVPQFLKS
jgi:NAD(P)H-dependent flavin oxidoreductase YrpB (nitropropane dioxygenase family)